MSLNAQFPVDLSIFTEEILNRKPHFFCSVDDCWLGGVFQSGYSFL